MEPRHSHTGQALSDWIERIPNELPFDGVGLWQIVPTLRHDFRLQGPALEHAVRATVEGLMQRGAVPVRFGGEGEPKWVPSEVSNKSPDEVAEFIVRKWVDAPTEPTVTDLWFALPTWGCTDVVRSWYLQHLARWEAAGIATTIKVAPPDGDLEKVVVTLEARAVLAMVAAWGNGLVESILLDTRNDTDPRVSTEEFHSHADLRGFLERSSARVFAIVQGQ